MRSEGEKARFAYGGHEYARYASRNWAVFTASGHKLRDRLISATECRQTIELRLEKHRIWSPVLDPTAVYEALARFGMVVVPEGPLGPHQIDVRIAVVESIAESLDLDYDAVFFIVPPWEPID